MIGPIFCRAHLEAEKQLRKQVEEMDKPPKYNSVVLREDPPEYMVKHSHVSRDMQWTPPLSLPLIHHIGHANTQIQFSRAQGGSAGIYGTNRVT